jgi:DNA invertase Pin-like site-specific DNA recombinase/DNA-binding winged helix-turn-helix (wHTH) protein
VYPRLRPVVALRETITDLPLGWKGRNDMPAQPLIPAAEYVRMSTDDQQNSIPFQTEAIRRYAAKNGFEVVATYSDPGKSGLAIRNRPGLRSLLRDVVNGKSQFRAILVYDVSRWGRFQDADEAAHYEFICRQAGVPVYYCAETFVSDGTVSGTIMKSLKRTMAAEYSRELSIKTSDGQRRLAGEGFRVGSCAGFGLRRMMISADGRRKLILKSHEHKYTNTDRVILVPGPRQEVKYVQRIFELSTSGRMSCAKIAVDLNTSKVEHWGRPWTAHDVYRILKNHKYMGWNVWGKTHRPFESEWHKIPEEGWTIKKNAFSALITPEQFNRAQRCLRRRRRLNVNRRSDGALLSRLERVWRLEGELSDSLLMAHGFDPRNIRRRFGSSIIAYRRIGYHISEQGLRCVEGLKRTSTLRAELMLELKRLFPLQLRRTRLGESRVLEVDKSVNVAVHVCWRAAGKSEVRWRLEWRPVENGLPVLICLTERNPPAVTDYYLIPKLVASTRRGVMLRKDHPLLLSGRRLESLRQFYEATKELIQKGSTHSDAMIRGDLIIVPKSKTITVADKEIDLPNIQAAILAELVKNAGLVVSKERLCEVAIAASRCKMKRLLDLRGPFLCTNMNRLRRIVGVIRNRLVTVRGKGYMYVDHPLLRGKENNFARLFA